MIILKRKIFSVSIIFILISFVLILLVITSLVEDIKRNSQDYVLQRKALVLLQRQFQEFEDFEKDSVFYQSNLEKLDKLLVDPEVPVDFIQFLEEESQKLNLSIKISPISIIPQETDPWESMGFQVLLTGSFPKCWAFLEKIQASPWLFEIERLEIRRISEKEFQSEQLKSFSLGDVSFFLDLKVYIR